MKRLPSGWEKTQFCDALERIVGGGTPSKAITSHFSGSIPFMTVKDLNARFPKDTIDHINSEAVESSATAIVPRDTLIVATRMSLGKIARPRRATAINQDLKALFLKDGFDKTFVEFLWRSLAQHIQSLGTGTTVKGIRIEDIRTLEIPVPPSAEQKRIADKLEAVLGRVDACRTRLDRLPALLKRFRQSVLAAAVSGKLTESWREETTDKSTSEQLICRIFEERARRYDAVCKECISVGNKPPKKPKNLTRQIITRPGLPEIPESWQWVCWDDITDWITYGFTRPMPHVKNGISIITAKNVRDGFLDFTQPEQTTAEAFLSLSEKDKPRRNEILITKDGAIRGRAALVETDEQFCISQSVAVLRFGGLTAHEPFLLRVIQDKFTQNLIEEESSGMAIPHLSITNFGRFPVPIPPLPEQQEIVRRIEALFAMADRIEARLATAQKTIERLTPATLAKAFRGELVPQDPNDEPASVLLKRVQTDKAALPLRKIPVKRGRKTRASEI